MMYYNSYSFSKTFNKHFFPNEIHHLRIAKCKRILGKGSFGIIKLYQCKEQHNNECCKQEFVIKQCCSKSKKMMKELSNEYTIGSLINHENIRKTLDYDISHQCIIFEHFEGIDLFEVLNQMGPLKEDHTIVIIKQMLQAIDYLYSLGIAHMDIKLENIMYNPETKKIKLIDFGESLVFSYNNKLTNICEFYGTESCAAPEVFFREYQGDKVDIWSCGIVLYELIYFKLPWAKAEPNQICFDLHTACIKKKNLNSQLFPYYTYLTKNLFIGMLQPDSTKRLLAKQLLEYFPN